MSGESLFSQWCLLELMGHRRLGGLVTHEELFGQPFVRIDVHREAEVITQYYSPQAVYCLTPTTEQLARRVGALSRPQPVSPWELEAGDYGRADDDGDETADGERQPPF